MTILILNTSQAKAIYSAMCTLNNIGGYLSAITMDAQVIETLSGNILITAYARKSESYTSQAEFATAYGLIEGSAN